MTKTTTDIQAVLFDYGQVLSGPPDPAAWERMREALQASEKLFHEAYWRYRNDYDMGILNAPSYWGAVANLLGQQLSLDLLKKLVDADVDLWTQPNQEMIDWAAALQRAGYKTGILSNIGDAMESGVLDRLAWMNDFAHHTFSHRTGTAKPEAVIYTLAVEGLGVAPEHILFVDDREENITAARAAGMTAIRYADHSSFVKSMREAGLEELLTPQPR